MKEYISRSLGHNRSSLLSSKGFSATAETAACTDSHRQHVCGFVYKSSRRVKIAPRVGTDDLEPLALRESGGGSVRQEREHPLPVVLHSPLTSRWPAARPYAFPPIKKCCRWCYERSGWSEHQWYSSPRTSLGSQTWRNCWRHRLADPRQEVYAIPGGGLGVALEPGTMEPSCVIASGVSEEMGALQSCTLMGARKPSTRRLYASNGSVCEGVRLISTRLLAPYRMFWVSRCTDWIVDRYHRHWSLCRGHCRVRSPQSGQSFGKKDYIPHVHFVSALGPGSGLRALSLQPFGPLTSVGLKELFLKTTVLLAFASAKRIEHLHAFSVDSDCIRFGPGDCSVTLQPRLEYVPKSLSTPFERIETVSPSALATKSSPSQSADA